MANGVNPKSVHLELQTRCHFPGERGLLDSASLTERLGGPGSGKLPPPACGALQSRRMPWFSWAVPDIHRSNQIKSHLLLNWTRTAPPSTPQSGAPSAVPVLLPRPGTGASTGHSARLHLPCEGHFSAVSVIFPRARFSL